MNHSSKVISPLTLKDNVEVVESFSVSKICEQYRLIGVDVERFFKGVSSVDLYKCKDTGYRFYVPFSVIGDALFYEDLSKNRKSYYSERWEHRKALDFIINSDNVLEIGAGFGAFATLLKKKGVDNYSGLELNTHAVAECNEKKLNVKQSLIEEEAANKKKYYDIVCSFQVLEHVVDVKGFLESSIRTLKKGGKIIIGVPNNNPYLFINDKFHTLNLPPHHAGLWDKNTFLSLENIFSIKLSKIMYEPLRLSYQGFLLAQLKQSNFLLKFIFKICNKLFPTLLKKVVCKVYKGRNILVIYEKK